MSSESQPSHEGPEKRAAPSGADHFFRGIVRNARGIVLASALLVGAASLGLFSLEKDPRSKAYMAEGHPAYLALERVEESFGLADAVVVAVVREGPGDIYNPQTLSLIHWLSEATEAVPGVDPERVTSLATVKEIVGSDDGMRIEPFFEGPVREVAEAERVRRAVMGMDLYLDKLVSRDGRATVIVAELLDAEQGDEVYRALRQLAETAPGSPGDAIHVAGIGAYNALVGEYIDADAARLNPITGLLIVLMLIVAYRTWRGVWVPFVAIAGSVIVAMGTMGALGFPVYGITNSMSIILIAIAVCDAIHILGHYYSELARDPEQVSGEVVVRAMRAMWRPVVITSLTSISGFLALSIASPMPPMHAYGAFASLGVLAALGLSVLTIPAILSLLPARPSPVFGGERPDFFARASLAFGRQVVRHSNAVLALCVVVLVLGVWGLSRVEVEEDTVQYFAESEPLRLAELAINRRLGGVANLDIVFETQEPEGLYQPERLRYIAALQRHLEALPEVSGSFSLADYVAQMHQAMNAEAPPVEFLPDSADLVAQYFLIYSASADPTDFDDVADHEFREANLRVALRDSRWSTALAVQESAMAFLAEHRQGEGLGMRVVLAGWGNVRFHMRHEIAGSVPLGSVLASLAVLATAVLCFRSLLAGLFALLPVGLALLLQFAVMGLSGTWLSLITSMGAALAIGLSVDFAIHSLDRLVRLVREEGRSLRDALPLFYQQTGRALVFNFVALAFGFGVLTTSLIPAMRDFGLVLVTCIVTGFLASLVILPVVVLRLRPRFLKPGRRPEAPAVIACDTAPALEV